MERRPPRERCGRSLSGGKTQVWGEGRQKGPRYQPCSLRPHLLISALRGLQRRNTVSTSNNQTIVELGMCLKDESFKIVKAKLINTNKSLTSASIWNSQINDISTMVP